MKTYVKILLFVVSFIAIAGILAFLYMYNMKHTDMSKAGPDFITTASILQKEFEDDETAASSRYVNRILEVTGTIESVKPAENNTISISLESENPFSSIICTFTPADNFSVFKPGAEITIRGECSGFLMDVLLNNCSVIKDDS